VASREHSDEATNRAAREHIEKTRKRLRDGRDKLARLQAEIDDTNRHIETMTSCIEENERALQADRERRSSS